MIEIDIDVEIEKKLIKMLGNKVDRFIEYLKKNNIDITNKDELEEAVESFEKKEKENKTIYGINKVLLIYTLSLFYKKLSSEKQDKFKKKIESKDFISIIKTADKRLKQMYLDSIKRTAYVTDKYIEKIRREKQKADVREFDERIKAKAIPEVWEYVKEKMETSNILNTVKNLGEIQAEYSKAILEILGINSFVWKTRHDGRVREKHQWRHGKVFDMNGQLIKGSAGDTDHILPKQEWGCRCIMVINENDVEGGLDNA